MNNKAVTLSLIMAVLAVFFVESYVTSIEEEARKKFGTETLVLTAKVDIKEMKTINETMLELKLIPKRFLEPAAVSYTDKDRKNIKKQVKDFAGTVAIVPIRKGEQITYNKITEPNLRTGLSPQVTPGRRAVTVPVDEVTSVGKLVKPGDRVDLIAIMDLGGPQKTFARTILQDVVVLAVGRNVTNNVPRVVEKDPGGKRDRIRNLTQFDGWQSVTVEVDPSQAQMLALVVSNTRNRMQMSLRNNDDTDRIQVRPMKLLEVMGVSDTTTRGPARNRKR